MEKKFFSRTFVKTVKLRKRFNEHSLKFRIHTPSYISGGASGPLAHFEAPDDHLIHYTRSVWRELKERMIFRPDVKRRKKFKEIIRHAFETYCARNQNNNQHVTKAL